MRACVWRIGVYKVLHLAYILLTCKQKCPTTYNNILRVAATSRKPWKPLEGRGDHSNVPNLCATTSLVNFFMNCCGVRSKGVAPQWQSKIINFKIIIFNFIFDTKTLNAIQNNQREFKTETFILKCIFQVTWTSLVHHLPDCLSWSDCFHLLEKYASSTHLSPPNMQWTWEKSDFAAGDDCLSSCVTCIVVERYPKATNASHIILFFRSLPKAHDHRWG